MSHEPPLNLADYEALAPARMHPAVWDFISAGRPPHPPFGAKGMSMGVRRR